MLVKSLSFSLSGMDPHRAYSLTILFIVSVIALQLEVIYGDSSVVFLDSPTHNYLRESAAQTGSFSPSELGATASVLLGFAPPSTLTAASSSKLNQVLTPNPFNRPRAMLMLEVTGVEDSQLVADSNKSPFRTALRIKVEGDQRVNIELPDQDQVSLVSLNRLSSDTECSDKDLSDFVSWLGGSYVEDASKPLSGELVISIADGAFLRLHMSERADREFATSLVFLINNIRSTMEMHQMLSNSKRNPAELITGRFDGIKALCDHYGKEGIAQSGLEVFINSISKAFDSLQAAYEGQIVGVIVHGGPHVSETKNIIHVTATSRPARSLEATKDSLDSILIYEILFVRKTLAWITGIILLVATILGIHFLMNMPLTKDTLLYSNVKLD